MLKSLVATWHRLRSRASGTAEPVHRLPSPKASLASVRDGRVVILNSSSPHLPPVLVPSPDVVLLIDGQPVTQPVTVWEGMDIRVAPRSNSQDSVRPMTVTVAPDAMAAWLHLPPIGPLGYRVADVPPSHVVHLTVEPLADRQATPTLEQVEQALAAAGVVRGIDRAAIRNALDQEGEVRVTVATGKPPVPGRPGRVDSVVRDDSAGDGFAPDQRVQPGEQIAWVIPPSAGRPGWDVRGRILDPECQPPVRLIAGDGVVLEGDPAQAFALAPGRPQILHLSQDACLVTVVPVLEMDDPAPDLPPIHFDGDVVLRGSRLERLTVHATGWIWLQGPAWHCSLEAGQGIWTEHVVQRCRLFTRTPGTRLTPIQDLIAQILSDLQALKVATMQVLSHPRYSQVSRGTTFTEVVRILVEKRFAHLRDTIARCRQAISAVHWAHPPIDLHATLNTVEWLLFSAGVKSASDLDQVTETLSAAQAWLSERRQIWQNCAPVHVATALFSEIDAEGDVRITGLEESLVRSTGGIAVSSLRGGTLQAGSTINIGTAGGMGPSTPCLEVPEHGSIRIGRAVRPVSLKVGNWRRRTQPREERILVGSASGVNSQSTAARDSGGVAETIGQPR